jgi:hypothetical protein
VEKPGSQGFKPKRSGLICKDFSMVEGYLCKFKNPMGFPSKQAAKRAIDQY